MRAAAELLLIESFALRPIVVGLDPEHTDRETVCTGWSVRDVLGHCGAALTIVGRGDIHGFSPAENEVDVEIRREWPFEQVLAELFDGYEAAAARIDETEGSLDGIGLGEWMHGGDVREALDAPNPYTSDGVDLAHALLLERSRLKQLPAITVHVDDSTAAFGVPGEGEGTLTTDLETFVRLCGGRRPDPSRYHLSGAAASDLVLFG